MVVQLVAALKVEVANGTREVFWLQLSEAIVFQKLAETSFTDQSYIRSVYSLESSVGFKIFNSCQVLAQLFYGDFLRCDMDEKLAYFLSSL